MNKTIRTFLLGALALVFAAFPAFAQLPAGNQALTATTLSAAMTTASTVAYVASATGCPGTGTYNRVSNPCTILVDSEQMRVQAISGRFFTVTRGINGTAVSAHVSASPVMMGSPAAFPTVAAIATNEYRINFTNFQTPITSVAATSTTDVAGTEWFSAIYIPQTTILTGACQLNGGGSVTDHVITILWDKLGNVLANSAVAGTQQATASIYQCEAFVNPVAVSAGKYFVGVQGDATTAGSFGTYAAGSVGTGYATGNQTGTFGTVAAITTVPTTFTADKGPKMSVY